MDPLRRWVDELGTFALALTLAVVVWVVAVREENPIEQGDFPEAIPVKVRNKPPGTTLLPMTFNEQVRLTVRAPRSSWQSLRTDKFSAWIDLKGKEPGDYDMPVQASCIDPNVRIVEVRPASVPVHLQRESSRAVPVQVHLYGSAALGYEIKTGEGETIIAPATVTVTGPASLVEQVTKATVDLYLRDVKETVVATRRVVARQTNGDPVGDFVRIQPPTVQITVPVVQKTGFNEVAVRPVITGTVAPGYWVRNVTVDPATVTLVGDPSVVSRIRGYVETSPLDISGATGDVVERMPLDLPEGASTVGVQGVLVTVHVEPLRGRLTVWRPPIARGLSTDLTALISPDKVAVTLTGPLPRLNSLTDEDVPVYVELVDLGVGRYRLPLSPLVPEGLTLVSVMPDTVEVVISRVPPTPTPTPTFTPTPTPAVTGTLTATPGITLTLTPAITVTLTPTHTGG